MAIDSELVEVGATDVPSPSGDMVRGRLRNSEIMLNLDKCCPHLTLYQREDVVSLIKTHLSLFSNVLIQTHVLTHDRRRSQV